MSDQYKKMQNEEIKTVKALDFAGLNLLIDKWYRQLYFKKMLTEMMAEEIAVAVYIQMVIKLLRAHPELEQELVAYWDAQRKGQA